MSNVATQPAWLPSAPEEWKVRWYAWTVVEADARGVERGRVAWLYRIMFGEWPSERVSKMARRIRRG